MVMIFYRGLIRLANALICKDLKGCCVHSNAFLLTYNQPNRPYPYHDE